MIIIKKLVNLLQVGSNGTIEQKVVDFLALEFRMLHEHLGDGCELDDFDLESHGPMYVAVPADGKLAWAEITKQMSADQPEFIEKHRLNDGST